MDKRVTWAGKHKVFFTQATSLDSISVISPRLAKD